MSHRLALFDGDEARRYAVYRTMNVEGFYVEPFETIEEVLSLGRGFDSCLIADDAPWDSCLHSETVKKLAFTSCYVAYSSEPDIERIVDVVRNGAAGYLVFPFSHDAAKASLINNLGETVSQSRKGFRGAVPLTAKENEVATYLVEGLSNDELAKAMGISRRTVEWHRHNMRRKVIDRLEVPNPDRKTIANTGR